MNDSGMFIKHGQYEGQRSPTCIKYVFRGDVPHSQPCGEAAGHGPGGNYCEAHARLIEVYHAKG